MKLFKSFLISLTAILALSSAAIAGNFSWTEEFNIQAEADPSGFRAKLATRFNLGDVQIDAVLTHSNRPADAYIMLRLGEMSGKTTGHVVEKYRKNKSKGWGALAKGLGVKPGSREFHALKRSQDLYDGNNHSQAHVSRNKREMLTLLTLVIAKEKVHKVKK